MPNTCFLTKEHVGSVTVLALEDKMSFPNLTLEKEHWLLEKESLLFNFTGACSVTATVYLSLISSLRTRVVCGFGLDLLF